MVQPIPTATYRIQLRGGVDFAAVQSQLPRLSEMGISHLYLSPIFAAGSGSTHGYDVLDPTAIEPVLGGRDGFERLARAAHGAGLGVILDIVPNHTAFSLENPWLLDVLAHGQSSRYGQFFDIDWGAGPLALPILPDPFGTMLRSSRFSASGGFWRYDDVEVPLAADGPQAATTAEELAALHEQQHWRLRHWETERDSVTHRRFFNVTGLVGMRVEDDAVFDATHALIFELVRAGLVDGLRVDHIDGLIDPEGYLERLRAALPDTPVWVEKILVGEETLPTAWKTVGTTGYESARLIARLLTDKAGLETLDRHWRTHTGVRVNFESALERAKTDILGYELSAELHQLVAMARSALRDDVDVEAGPEGLREAIVALLGVMPHYRTYISARGVDDADRRLIGELARKAGAKLRSPHIVEHLAQRLLDPSHPPSLAFALRFQQVSGALLAKSQEDTAGFRWTRYLAANEVGAEPEEATVDTDEANRFLGERRPTEMNLTSSHDTKRSEDARMRLVAISHHPDAFAALVAAADQLDPNGKVDPKWRWYIVQSALAIWGDTAGDLEQRLADHLLKAMREAKESTYWTRPVAAVEDQATAFARALCKQWSSAEPAELGQLIETGRALSLAQLAFKCLMPGFPDIYRGGEGPFLALTDPDNRLPVDPAALAELEKQDGFAGDKARLARTLLHLRKHEPDFFETADASLAEEDGGFVLRRRYGDRVLAMTYGGNSEAAADSIAFTTWAHKTLTVCWQ